MLQELSFACAIAPVAVGAYAYGGYPLALTLLARRKRARVVHARDEWPSVTLVLPVYNEARIIDETLRHVMDVDYPRDRLQILVVSDASDDGTDDVVRRYATSGVELLRLPNRRGKTAAENAASGPVRGEIVVNMDASVRIERGALRALVRAFDDPTVGVASGRDVTTRGFAATVDHGEGRYTSFEMRLRSLETTMYGIVGASGCFFAARRELHRLQFPEHLSRDFGSALVARVHGYRAVAVDDAVCFVPCAPSLAVERRRKVRTMTRGIGTLWHMRTLLDPVRYGVFSWMLFSHKLCRWFVPLSFPIAIAGMVVLSVFGTSGTLVVLARIALAAALVFGAAAWAGWMLAARASVPKWLALPAFVGASLVAGIQAWSQWMLGRQKPVWDPTRRPLSPARE